MPNDDGIVTLPGLSGIRVPSTKGDPVSTREWWDNYSCEVLYDIVLTEQSYGVSLEDFIEKVYLTWGTVKEQSE